MSTVPEALRPSWDCVIPGRLDWEIERLNAQARNVNVDEAKLAEGTVQIDLEWPVRGDWVPVRATYPDTYPDTRPHVQLLTDPSTWPRRHVSPLDGSLCLLGRDPRQWRPTDGLAGLLMLQLETALHGGGAEDPQAEPMEVWWNNIGLPDSYCLVDSGWDLSTADGGLLTIKLVLEAPKARAGREDRVPAFRMAVTEVRSREGQVLAQWQGPLPQDLAAARSFTFPWVRSATTLVASVRPNAELTALRGGAVRPSSAGQGLSIRGNVFVHPIELTESREGDGWVVLMEWGEVRDFSPPHGKHAKPRAPRGCSIPVLRAGVTDLGSRVPAFATLAGKQIAIIGVGALGAPVAIELARNGAAELRLLDHDTVEPGNSVRWPLGAVAWGRPKVDALRAHIEHHYPRCTVDSISHMIGGLGQSDDAALAKLMDGADLVIDASASATVNMILWRRCAERGLPLIKLGATPEVRGGTVMMHAPGGACPTCLSIARAADLVSIPAGERDDLRLQPIGCAEPTFVGADYDLLELSLQAVRATIGAMERGISVSSVFTLNFRDDHGTLIPPAWTHETVEVQAGCPSHWVGKA